MFGTDKAFDITYVRLLFHTSRPESFAIYKKKCEECDWQPMQYYSGSCFSTYGIDNKVIPYPDVFLKFKKLQKIFRNTLCLESYSAYLQLRYRLYLLFESFVMLIGVAHYNAIEFASTLLKVADL